MTLSQNIVAVAAIAYAALLFLAAFLADQGHRRGRMRWLNSPIVYTLSISVYCTSWTFYGAVGSAARSGLEYLPIYLGPTLVFIGWWALMGRIVRLGQAQRTTSIADFLSSRYGKSPALAATATVIAVVAILPYIALQLRAISASFQVFAPSSAGGDEERAILGTAIWVAAGLALFAIIFGTRNLDANERHQGVVAAIALEAVVKLFALVAVGLFAVYGVAGGWGEVVAITPETLAVGAEVFDARWAALTFLSAAAVICLPRQFQVTVVECADERHGATASWLFPLYIFLISLFVAPIAAVGMHVLPAGSNPDLFVLTLPLAQGQDALALLVFLGGFSSATSMIIVSSIALSTMISNHLAMPLALPRRGEGVTGDLRRFLLTSRRLGVCLILGLGFGYLAWSGDSKALASIGLISFAGVAQFLPLLIAGLFWRRATAAGALAGLLAGFAVWFATLFAPSLATVGALLPADRAAQIFGDDPLVSTLFWSLAANIGLLVVVSLLRDASPIERIQSALFLSADRLGREAEDAPLIQRTAAARDLYVLAQRILGGEAAHRLFEEYCRRQGATMQRLEVDAALISDLERRLSAGVGAASAHALVSQIAVGGALTIDGLVQIADENARLMHYSGRMEEQSRALRESARELREANERLRELDAQKDDFLAQISHELRTPMTSMRSFSELLQAPERLSPERIQRFAAIIHQECLRLTRLLDQVLDFGRIERGDLTLSLERTQIEPLIDRTLAALTPLADEKSVAIERESDLPQDASVTADPDRMQQVLMNVVSNSIKFNDSADPRIWLEARSEIGLRGRESVAIYVSDNGPGVPTADAERIFEMFQRGGGEDQAARSGVGLGLAISREIMARHDGEIRLAPSRRGGATFRIELPRN